MIMLFSECYLMGEVNKAWGEDSITDYDHKECRIYGPQGSQLSNCAEIIFIWVKGNSCKGRSQAPTHSPPTQETHQPKRREKLRTWTYYN